MRSNSIFMLLILAVSSTPCFAGTTHTDSAETATLCTTPRPEICTMDYRPVCATKDTGIRCVTTPCNSTEIRTYSNACSACSDKQVVSHRPGTCSPS